MVNLGNFFTSFDLRLFFVGYGAIDQHICEEIGLLEFSSRSCTEMPWIIIGIRKSTTFMKAMLVIEQFRSVKYTFLV